MFHTYAVEIDNNKQNFCVVFLMFFLFLFFLQGGNCRGYCQLILTSIRTSTGERKKKFSRRNQRKKRKWQNREKIRQNGREFKRKTVKKKRKIVFIKYNIKFNEMKMKITLFFLLK